jgi:hypothetical protein
MLGSAEKERVYKVSPLGRAQSLPILMGGVSLVLRLACSNPIGELVRASGSEAARGLDSSRHWHRPITVILNWPALLAK